MMEPEEREVWKPSDRRKYLYSGTRPVEWHSGKPIPAIIKQAARVDYRGKTLSEVMNEALHAGYCPLYPWRKRREG